MYISFNKELKKAARLWAAFLILQQLKLFGYNKFLCGCFTFVGNDHGISPV